MASPASRSQGSRSHPCAQFTRFTEEENKRLTKLCRKRGLTVQTFMHAATMRALREAELGNKTDAERIHDGEETREPAYEPKGLGIRDRLRPPVQENARESDDYEHMPSQPQPLPPQPSPAAADNDLVLALAHTVIDSPQSTRRETLRAAVLSLARGRTQEAALQLADDLDAAIKRLDGTPKTALDRARARMK